ncbi:hypothetical protein BH24BAC1_BH24BAC1_01590 [soil metagenome]
MFFSLPALVNAQNQGNSRAERMEKIHNAKVSFIGDKMNLSGDQAKQFWPVYNEYENKRHELRHKSRPFRNTKLEDLSDQQMLEGIKAMQNVQQMELNLEKEYTDRFLKILTVRQVVEFHKAEREFTKALLQKMDSRHGGKPNL